MAYPLSAGFALIALTVAGAAVANDDEALISQMSVTDNNTAFVQQLPETAVVPLPGPAKKIPKAERPAPKKVVKRLVPVHSIFPNVGSGVGVTADSDPAGVQLPTVGAGATRSL